MTATWSLGIDVSCRSAHQATLLRDGETVWKGWKFTTSTDALSQLWEKVMAEDPQSQVTVVVEPTRNAWIVVADKLRVLGAKVVMVPSHRSADLRAYFSKYTKNDRLDSDVLARVVLLHPEGLPEYTGQGPADVYRTEVKQRETLVHTRTAHVNRLDAKLEILGPLWFEVFGSTFGVTALTFLAQMVHPRTIIQRGPTRLATLLSTHSRGQWGIEHATAILAACRESLALWDDPTGGYRLDFDELAADIALEARMAQHLNTEIAELDARLAAKYQQADPDQVVRTVPGIGPVLAAGLVGRLGDISRFDTIAAIRSYTGLIPAVNQSGTSDKPCPITKAGDPLLRQMLFTAADHARRSDPQLASTYKRLRNQGKHHISAVCHIATRLVTRIAACIRDNKPYQIRDVDGTPISAQQGRTIVRTTYRYQPENKKNTTRATKKTIKNNTTPATRASRESQKSPKSAPTTRPATPSLTTLTT